MSDVSAVRRSMADELADLQADNNRKKKKISEAEKQELKEMQQNFESRKETLGEETEAAVNHIRKDQTQTLTQAEAAREKAQARAQEQTTKVEDMYKKRLSEMQTNRDETLHNAREQLHQKVAALEDGSHEKLQALKDQTDKEYQYKKAMSAQELKTMNSRYEQHRKEVDRQNQEEIKHASQMGRSTLEKVNEDNEKNIQTARNRGQEKINSTKESEEQKYNRLEEANKKKYEKEVKAWADRDRNLDQEYGKKITRMKEAYDGEIKQQRQHFDSAYAKNEDANQRSFRIQSLNATKELNELKSKFLREANHYAGKENDPFYKVQDRGSELKETSHYYVLDAYVPEHEKEDIKVVLEKNRAVVQGQRSFKDRFEQEEGKKVASESYQSFREEFPFDKPVMIEGASRERNGDWLRIIVPKLASYSKKV